MELRRLRNFLAIVDHKSLSKAASVVRLAQPALSRQIKALEEELGVPLLVRHGWGVTPTPEGAVLAVHARQLLQQEQTARAAIGALAGSPSGLLTIGVPSSLAAVLLPELALAASRLYPQLQLRLVEGYSASLHQRTISGELDIAILYSERRMAALVTRPLLVEPLLAFGRAGQFGKRAAITLAELAAMGLILPASSNRLRMLFEEAAAEAGLAGGVRMEVDSVPALIALAAAGAGVSILPCSAIRSGIDQGQLSAIPIGPQPLARTLILARPAERLITPAWRAMAALVQQIARGWEDRYGWTVHRDAEGPQ